MVFLSKAPSFFSRAFLISTNINSNRAMPAAKIKLRLAWLSLIAFWSLFPINAEADADRFGLPAGDKIAGGVVEGTTSFAGGAFCGREKPEEGELIATGNCFSGGETGLGRGIGVGVGA